MSTTASANVHLVTEPAEGYAVATVDLPATTECLFEILTAEANAARSAVQS